MGVVVMVMGQAMDGSSPPPASMWWSLPTRVVRLVPLETSQLSAPAWWFLLGRIGTRCWNGSNRFYETASESIMLRYRLWKHDRTEFRWDRKRLC
jgi:hypothetical protein